MKPRRGFVFGLAIGLCLMPWCVNENGLTEIPIPPDPPVPIVDTAIPPEVHKEHAAQSWLQSYEVGVLRVRIYVDRSGSMNQELPMVGDAALALARVLDTGGPWEITFYTTSQGSPVSLGPFTSLSEESLIKAAPMSIAVVGGEAALGTIYQNPNPAPRGVVHVVFTDEDDQSFPPTLTHSTQYDEELMRHYWTVAEFAFWYNSQPQQSVIFVIPQTCARGPHARYNEAAGMIGAEVVDLCEDWNPWLGAFTWPFVDPQRDYTLAHDPIPASVEVRIGGLVSLEWSMNGRVVTLTNPPPVGTSVDIGYDYWTF